MLRLHHKADGAHGLESAFCAYFEPRNSDLERVHGLGLSGLSCIHTARRRFRALPGSPPQMMVWHNFWGLPFLADLDRAGRRLGVLHTDCPGLATWLRGLRGLVDGALCVSQPLLDMVHRELPELAGARSAWLPYPVARDQTEAPQAPLRARPIVLGFAGRLSFEQKRVDRFPALAEALARQGVNFEFEFMGQGPQADWLRHAFAGNARVRFHGRQTGDGYWSVLRRWDAVVFVTDYEGLPITLLEAMAVGVLPVFPAIGSGGDRYAAGVRSDLLYPAGHIEEAAAVVKSLAAAPESDIRELRRRANALVTPHLGHCYEEIFARHVRHVTEMPRISRQIVSRPRIGPRMLLPFGVLNRLWPGALWRPSF